MICSECRMGAHWNNLANDANHEKIKKDMVGKSKSMHALCKDKGCFCQHRLGRLIQK